jgi:hypothetical protein
VFEHSNLPDGKVLIPGAIDSTNNYIEQPRTDCSADRARCALVSRENVIAGTECGFGTFRRECDGRPDSAWAKFRSLAEGAQLARAPVGQQPDPSLRDRLNARVPSGSQSRLHENARKREETRENAKVTGTRMPTIRTECD